MSRLSEIKRLWNENNDPCNPEDYEWLIQQAERVEELGGEKEQYKLWFHRQKDKTVELYQQNQRYKQALVEIREYVNSDEFHDNCWDVAVINKILNQALKEDEA